ncbi:uncharacterized protein TNCV_1876961 [Trichonephila clavipes]|nr:uncharacterized protein TNCV_1876961 [Trichonephila clavipes]
MMARRKCLSLDEIANLLREISENEPDGGELPCSNLDSDEDIRSREESEKSADVTDNIPVNPDKYITKEGTEWIPHNSNVPGRFATRNVLRQNSGPTSFMRHNVYVSFLCYKG